MFDMRRISQWWRAMPSWLTEGARFLAIGSAGTVLQLALYETGLSPLGKTTSAIASWLVATLLTNAAHRALTFSVRGRAHHASDQIFAFVSCLVALIATTGALDLVPASATTATAVTIVAVNTAVGSGRFVAMRWWLRRPARSVVGESSAAPVPDIGASVGLGVVGTAVGLAASGPAVGLAASGASVGLAASGPAVGLAASGTRTAAIPAAARHSSSEPSDALIAA